MVDESAKAQGARSKRPRTEESRSFRMWDFYSSERSVGKQKVFRSGVALQRSCTRLIFAPIVGEAHAMLWHIRIGSIRERDRWGCALRQVPQKQALSATQRPF